LVGHGDSTISNRKGRCGMRNSRFVSFGIMVLMFMVIVSGCVRQKSTSKHADWINENDPAKVSNEQLQDESDPRYEQVVSGSYDELFSEMKEYYSENLPISFHYPVGFTVTAIDRPGREEGERGYVTVDFEFPYDFAWENNKADAVYSQKPEMGIALYYFDDFDQLQQKKTELTAGQKAHFRDLNGNIYEEFDSASMVAGKEYLFNIGPWLYHFTVKAYPSMIANEQLRDQVDYGFMVVLKTFLPESLKGGE